MDTVEKMVEKQKQMSKQLRQIRKFTTKRNREIEHKFDKYDRIFQDLTTLFKDSKI